MRRDAAHKFARAKLTEAGIETAALDARLLLLAAAEIEHLDLVSAPEFELTQSAQGKFNEYIARRLAFEPVSRILGHREFYGRDFRVTPDVLDPRADTECVVELALKHIEHGRFIDLGTGSGAIAITLTLEKPSLSGIATDISDAALKVAEANAMALRANQKLRFVQGSWFDGVTEKFDLIISNPPYIRRDAFLAVDVKNYDPALSLFGGADGLEAYQAIARDAASFLNHHGKVVLEIGFDQTRDVTMLFEQAGFTRIEKVQDLGGRDRGLAFGLK